MSTTHHTWSICSSTCMIAKISWHGSSYWMVRNWKRKWCRSMCVRIAPHTMWHPSIDSVLILITLVDMSFPCSLGNTGCVSLSKDVFAAKVWRPSPATISLKTSSNRRWSKDFFGLATISKTSLGLSETHPDIPDRRTLVSLVTFVSRTTRYTMSSPVSGLLNNKYSNVEA